MHRLEHRWPRKGNDETQHVACKRVQRETLRTNVPGIDLRYNHTQGTGPNPGP